MKCLCYRVLCIVLLNAVSSMAYAVSKHVQNIFPQATRTGSMADQQAGKPPSAAVYQNKKIIGYIFYTDEIVSMPAYSGKPIRTLVGLDAAGKIIGVKIVYHEEPILVTGINEEGLQKFINQYIGLGVGTQVKFGGEQRSGYHVIDSMSGATITAMVLNATITRSAHKVAVARGLIKTVGKENSGPTENQSNSAKSVQVNQKYTARQSKDETHSLWVSVWENRVFDISVLLSGLVVLLFILYFQEFLAKKRKLLIYLRTVFLIYTVVFIGWYALAQLSVVNVLAFTQLPFANFSWQSFMIEPLMFILWVFVAMTLLLWGRGVYCGWLCPFGALQEILYRIGKKLKVPDFELPEAIHERLWAVKYVLLLALFGISLHSLVEAERYAEVEPFKTVFTLHFYREWGYVLYAAVLLLLAVINRKFFCRYLCVLGAFLTFPAKFRVFDWLHRRKECGRSCQVCAKECEVRAINPNGEINANECHYCLDCQVTYHDENKCPPQIEKRQSRQPYSQIVTVNAAGKKL